MFMDLTSESLVGTLCEHPLEDSRVGAPPDQGQTGTFTTVGELSFGAVLRHFRGEAALTQEALADRSGVSVEGSARWSPAGAANREQ
jgi:hypothetical protein